MAERDIWIDQENNLGKYVRVLLQPTAEQHGLSLDLSGAPVVTVASSPIGDYTATSADATASAVAPSASYVQAEAAQVVTDLNAAITALNLVTADVAALTTKLNSVLAALRTHNLLKT
jgi:hypothetical protein